ASDNNLLFHRLADLIQRRRIINGRQIPRIASFANRLDRAAQHQPRHVLLVDRGLAKIARVSGRDVDFASLRHQHIGARVPV
ncbi:hypothetical protein, partial [Escherichia coli]|uniref:hypothetical protein n=1 Tax=Escherichia coli TaxID=562 RepID=UPI003A5D20AA|nr:hypothetical protein [Escherichia coli]